jgi:hypothetical protein
MSRDRLLILRQDLKGRFFADQGLVTVPHSITEAEKNTFIEFRPCTYLEVTAVTKWANTQWEYLTPGLRYIAGFCKEDGTLFLLTMEDDNDATVYLTVGCHNSESVVKVCFERRHFHIGRRGTHDENVFALEGGSLTPVPHQQQVCGKCPALPRRQFSCGLLDKTSI